MITAARREGSAQGLRAEDVHHHQVDRRTDDHRRVPADPARQQGRREAAEYLADSDPAWRETAGPSRACWAMGS